MGDIVVLVRDTVHVEEGFGTLGKMADFRAKQMKARLFEDLVKLIIVAAIREKVHQIERSRCGSFVNHHAIESFGLVKAEDASSLDASIQAKNVDEALRSLLGGEEILKHIF